MAAPEEEEDFAAMLAEFEAEAPAGLGRGPQVGDVVRGPVVSIGDSAVFIELGAKSEGVLDVDQVSDREGNVTVNVGDIVEARVVEVGANGIVLRRSVSRGAEAVTELVQAFEHGMPVEGLITGVNKGGVEVQVAGVRAFCPMSQLDNRFVEEPESFVGQKHQFRITKIEGGRRPNIVLSRRVLLEEESAELAAVTRAKLEVGLILRGTVSTIKPYGAFVDIGGLEGMLHISELGHGRVSHPSDVIREGQTVEVQVIKIEVTGEKRNPERISLSLKHLEPDPWADVAMRFPEGARIAGRVVRLQPFGAFVEIAPGIEGLVHISELGADRRINHPREIVKLGAEVQVTVLGVDLQKRRVSLSMAEAEEGDVTMPASLAPPRDALGTFGDLLKKKLK